MRLGAAWRGSMTAGRKGGSKMRKPTLPPVLPRFREYHANHPTWGALHVVLHDLNVADSDVRLCIQTARSNGDEEGEALARVLMSMSCDQRRKIAQLG